MRLSQREIAEKIGVSAGSFFGYRTGRNRITNKAWAKLEAAERAAGIISESAAVASPAAAYAVRFSDPKEFHPPPDHFVEATEMIGLLRDQLAEKDRQIDRLLSMLQNQTTRPAPP